MDKRPFYLWILVLIANIGIFVGGILFNISSSIKSHQSYSILEIGNIVELITLLFLSVVPVLISRSNSKLKNLYGYGIPVLLVLVVFFYIYR